MIGASIGVRIIVRAIARKRESVSIISLAVCAWHRVVRHDLRVGGTGSVVTGAVMVALIRSD